MGAVRHQRVPVAKATAPMRALRAALLTAATHRHAPASHPSRYPLQWSGRPDLRGWAPQPDAGRWAVVPALAGTMAPSTRKTGPAARSHAHHELLLHHRTRPHHRTDAIAGRQVRLTANPGGTFLQRPCGHVASAGAITARERLPSRE